MNTKNTPFKRILLFSYLSFSIPALLLLFVLISYTISSQIKTEVKDYQGLLEYYGNNTAESIDDSVHNLNNLTSTSPFQLMHYGNSAIQVHQSAYELLPIIQSYVMQESCIGGYFLYDAEYSYYCPIYRQTYAYPDQALIKEFLTQPAYPVSMRNTWIPFELSDRTVLLRLSGFDSTICALMIDPSLNDIMKSDVTGTSDEQFFFYTTKNEGEPYADYEILGNQTFPCSGNQESFIELNTRKWRVLQYSLKDYDLQLCCLLPYRNIWLSMNVYQKLLLMCIILLFFYNAFMLIRVLYPRVVSPLHELSSMMQKISSGSLELRIPENQKIDEYLHFSQTLNQMLDNIKHLKIESYTRQLDLQQAQLQYLQLQIRPHFYLNCLKGLYSMAEKKQYPLLQESILSLADYFRYMFKNNHDLISFSDEIHAVSSYLKLQQLNFSRNPKVTMDISSDVADLPLLPLSILTFVENSIKHAAAQRNIKIHIHATILSTEEQPVMNISISDNCGGFSSEALEALNHLDSRDFLYQDYHVGIYNVYYRMKLTYGDSAVLAFYNNTTGGTVELFIPITKEAETK